MRQKHSAFDLTLFLFPGWEIGLQTRSLHLSLSLVTTAIVLALFDSRAPTCHFGPPVHKFLAISGAFHSTKIAEIPGGEANGTNFGYTSRGCPNVPENRLDHSDPFEKKISFLYLSVVYFWKFLSKTEWNGSDQSRWYNQSENFRIYCSICHFLFSKFQIGIFGRMESAPWLSFPVFVTLFSTG